MRRFLVLSFKTLDGLLGIPEYESRHDLVELLKEEIGLDPSVHVVTNALKDITDINDDKGTTNTIGPGENRKTYF